MFPDFFAKYRNISNLLLSFVIAFLMIWFVPTIYGLDNSDTAFNNPFGSLSGAAKATIKVPVTVNYDKNKYFVTGAPEKVDVTVEGPSNLLNVVRRSTSIVANLDLTGQKTGTHEVAFKLQGLNSNFKYTINPAKTTVNITDNNTKTVSIQSDFNRDNIESGYIVQSFKISASSAEIVGNQDNINMVDHLLAYLDVPSKTNKSISTSVKLIAVDASGNVISGIQSSPSSVDVNLTVTQSNPDKPTDKVVLPLYLQILGGDSSKFSITMSANSAAIEIDPSKITAYQVNVPVDLSAVTKEQTIKVDLQYNGATSINPTSVNVIIKPKAVINDGST